MAGNSSSRGQGVPTLLIRTNTAIHGCCATRALILILIPHQKSPIKDKVKSRLAGNGYGDEAAAAT